MIISQSGIVDIIPEYNRQLRPIFCVSEGDKNTRMINITVQQAGENFSIPSGASVYVTGKKQDNTIFTYQCTKSGYIVSFQIAEQMSAANGIVLCELQIIENGNPLGSANFVYWVEPSPVQDGTASESDLNVFLEAIIGADKLDHFWANVEDAVTEAVEAIQIHEGQTVIDASLSVSGAAADAKATGDVVRAFMDALVSETTTEAQIASCYDAAGEFLIKRLVANIIPKQNLNGYDHPWPAGGGKNLLGGLLTTTGTYNGVTYTANPDGSFTVNGTNNSGETSDYRLSGIGSYRLDLPIGDYILNGGAYGTNGSENTLYLTIRNGSAIRYVGNNGITDSQFSIADGEYISSVFVRMASEATANNLVFKPMIRLATETDSTWQPYENICPISGYSAVNVYRTGKNLASLPNEETKSGVTLRHNRDGSVSISGSASAGADFTAHITQRTKAGEYILSGITGGSSNTYRLYVTIRNDGGGIRYVGLSDGEILLNVAENEYISGIFIRVYNGATVNATLYPMIRPASITDATFEPYTGATYSITFPTAAGTVYGGTLTVNSDGSGTLTVDKAAVTINGSVSPSSIATPDGATRATFVKTNTVFSGKTPQETGANYYGVCDRFKNATTSAIGNAYFNIYGSLQIYPPCDASVSAVNTWFSENPTTVVYPIATPTTYALSAVEVAELLQGVNNVWIDADGTLFFEYYANTALYVKKITNAQKGMIAGVEESMTATKNYVIGDLMIVGDSLYKVTAAISSGASLVIGTNITQTTVAEQLIALAKAK